MARQVIIESDIIVNIIEIDEIDEGMLSTPRENGTHAVIGGTYDEPTDSFIPKKPYASWVLSDSFEWKAPTQNPAELLEEHSYIHYDWNEDTENWVINNDSFKKLRREKYDLITDQLDQLYWDKKNGTNTWEESIDAVKAAYPKPTE